MYIIYNIDRRLLLLLSVFSYDVSYNYFNDSAGMYCFNALVLKKIEAVTTNEELQAVILYSGALKQCMPIERHE